MTLEFGVDTNERWDSGPGAQYVENNLDINNSDDVAKILDANDPEHKENMDQFVMLLKNAEAFMEMTSREKADNNTDLPN